MGVKSVVPLFPHVVSRRPGCKFSKASSRRKGLVQGRGSQAKRRVVKILSDRHVRCRQKSACRVIQTNQLFGSTAQNVLLLAGQLGTEGGQGQRAVRAPAVCAPVVRDGSDDDGCRRATDNLRDGFCFRLARGGRRLEERSQRFSLSLSNLDCPHLQRQTPRRSWPIGSEKRKK